MNYTLHYNALIAKRIKTPANTTHTYTEIHHAIPKCMGGTDDETNLVCLTAREHYMAHVLLCKIYPNNASAFRNARSTSMSPVLQVSAELALLPDSSASTDDRALRVGQNQET